MIAKSSGFLKLCIFVDGIDEFEGDHKDISAFLCTLAAGQVKVIASSRPISACVNAFQNCPTLRLQDLTKHDMELFVKAGLSAHPSMVALTSRFPEQASELVEEIKLKASSVFLWVKIVVRLLVDGIEEGDDIDGLQKKLSLLPPDLRALYRRMFAKMRPEHQVEAAEIFQLFHMWQSLLGGQPLRTLVLAFANQPQYQAFGCAVGPLAKEAIQWYCYNTEARIRSRCCGLIEVHGKNIRSQTRYPLGTLELEKNSGIENHDRFSEVDEEATISYLHLTVAEFLLSGDVWDEMCEVTRKIGFDPALKLACASLSMMKIQQHFVGGSGMTHFTNTLIICRRAANLSDQMLGRIFNGIDQTMHEHQVKFGRKNSETSTSAALHWSVDIYQVTLVHPSMQGKLYGFTDMLSVAARTSIIQYLRAFGNFQKRPFLSRYSIVVYALESWREYPPPTTTSCQDRSDTLLYLLQNAAKPEDAGLDGSLWQYAF